MPFSRIECGKRFVTDIELVKICANTGHYAKPAVNFGGRELVQVFLCPAKRQIRGDSSLAPAHGVCSGATGACTGVRGRAYSVKGGLDAYE